MKIIVNEWADKVVDKLLADGAIDRSTAEAYRFGVEVLFLKAAHIFSYLLIAAAMKKIPEFIVIFCVLSMFRKNTGGYHAKTRIGCYFFSCGIIVMGLFLSDGFVFIRSWQLYCLILTCLFLVWTIAPVENRNRRLDDSEMCYFRQRLALVSLFFLFLCLTIQVAAKDMRLPYLIAVGVGLNTLLTVMGKVQHRHTAAGSFGKRSEPGRGQHENK